MSLLNRKTAPKVRGRDVESCEEHFTTTTEQTYEVIDGRWISDEKPYVVLNRLCIADEAVDPNSSSRLWNNGGGK